MTLRMRLCLLICLSLCARPAAATIGQPDWFVRADAPAEAFLSGEAIEIPITVYVREDIRPGRLVVEGAGGWAGLDLQPSTARAARDFPGYRAETRVLRAGPAPRNGTLSMGLERDGAVEFQRFSLAELFPEADRGELVTHEVPRIDAGRFAKVGPAGDAAVSPVRAKAPRSVRVRGRLLFRVEESAAQEHGAEGVTVKVMKPEIFDDTTLASVVTDVNGDFDFTFTADGAMDFYVKVQAENSTAVNVGTGLFFTTYSRRWNFDDYTGSDVNLGTRVWSGNFNGALFLTTMITRAHRWVSDAGITPLSRVHVRFPDDSRGVSWYSPVGGTEGLHIRADNIWRIATLFHEYGHHFVSQRANSVPPQYCNGLCEDGLCGHCYWCQENNDIAWSEGFPHWFSHQVNLDHQRDYGWSLSNTRVSGSLLQCGVKMAFDRPMSTEGALAEFMADLIDTSVDNDPSFDTQAEDRISITVDDILHVATVDRPSNSPDFLRAMRDHIRDSPIYGDQVLVDFWAAVRNCGLDEDDVPPTRFSAVGSSTHLVGVATPSNVPTLEFFGGSDDFSNVVGGYVTITPSAEYPGPGGQLVEGLTGRWNTPLSPGTYYINVASVDGAGNRSVNHRSYGPIFVDPPVPVDLRPIKPPFWDDKLVVRNDTAANETFAAFSPTLLPGTDTWLNFHFENTSASGTAGAPFRTWFYIDGVNDVLFVDLAPPVIAGGESFTMNDIGPFQLTGGRHLIAGWADNGDAIPELLEDNNAFEVAVVVQPEILPPGNWVHFDTGPDPFPERPEGLSNTYPAMNGHRIAPTNSFGAVLVRRVDPSCTYYLYAFEPSTGSLDGFEVPEARSQRHDQYQAIVVNTQAIAGSEFDIGAYKRWDGIRVGYDLKHVDSVVLSPGASRTIEWGADDVFTLIELDNIATNFNMNVQATFDPADPDPEFRMYWIGATTTADGLVPYGGIESDVTGFARFFTTFMPAGRNAIAIVRNPASEDVTLPVTLQIETSTAPLPEFVMPEELEGWDVSMLPRPNFDDSPIQNLPKEIYESNGVYLNFAVQNQGPLEGQVPWAVFLDSTEQPWFGGVVDDVQPGENGFHFSPSPLFMPAGRHSLTLMLDPFDQVAEYVNTNNVFGLQFGVTGPTLNTQDPITRPAPPRPDLGLDTVRMLYRDVENGEGADRVPITFRAPNCDGLRLAASGQGKAGTSWVAAASMPGAQSDVDLRLHRTAANVAESYVEVLATSHSGTGASDYVLVNETVAGAQDYDVGVLQVEGFESYTSHAAHSVEMGAAGGSYGPFQLGPERIVDLYSFDLGVGTYIFKVDGGGKPLGATLHAPLSPSQLPYHSKSDLENGAFGVSQPPENAPTEFSIEILPGDEGHYCLAVWKPDAGALLDAVDYIVQVDAQPGDPGPVVVDGNVDGSYDLALAIQTTQTSFGDADLGVVDVANGSELDQVFALRDEENLYLLFAGNLESNLNDLEIFLDTRPGGQNQLRGDNGAMPDGALARMGDDGSGNGLRFDAGISPDWYFTVSGGDSLPYRLVASMAELPTGGGGPTWLLGATMAGSHGRLYGPEPEVQNPYGVRVSIDNRNTGGVKDGQGQDSGAGVTTGVELAIPLAAIGDPVGCIRVCAFVNGREHDFVSNQVLGPLPPGTGNLGEPRSVDFSSIAGDQFFDVCGALVVGVPEDLPTRPVDGLARLNPASPNPFNPRTTLSFALAEAAEVELSLYDTRGRRVRRVAVGRYGAGEHEFVWNGFDDAGRAVGSGIYLVELRAGAVRQTRKIALVR